MDDSMTPYGPLAAIIGIWKGDKGTDIAPNPAIGTENNPYYETLTCEAAGSAFNAKQQTLWVVRYHLQARRKSNDEVFHDQVGYWTWDSSEQVVTQSVSIPRAVCILAGGSAATDGAEITSIKVNAAIDDLNWGVLQSPFMEEKAKTTAYELSLTVDQNTLHYEQSTQLEIYGEVFNHTDENTLTRSA